MNKDVQHGFRAVLVASILSGLLGHPGCSNNSNNSESKAAVESKRDALQKATQSGVPGKTPGAGGKRR